MSDKQVNKVEVSEVLDITQDLCPMTFVKARLFIEKRLPGQVVEIHLAAGEPLDNLPNALTLDGHEVLKLEELDHATKPSNIDTITCYRMVLQICGESGA